MELANSLSDKFSNKETESLRWLLITISGSNVAETYLFGCDCRLPIHAVWPYDLGYISCHRIYLS